MPFVPSIFLSLVVALISNNAFSWDFTKPDDVHLSGDVVLAVTHATTLSDSMMTAKQGLDTSVEYAKKNHIPVVYLQHSLDATYYAKDKQPDYFVRSEIGEFHFELPPTTFITNGGNYSACQQTTMQSLVVAWSKKESDLKVCTVTSAIYDRINDPELYKEFGNYAVSLAAILNRLPDDSARIAIFKKQLVEYYPIRTFLPHYRVLIQYRGQEEVVFPGHGASPHKLVYKYIHGQPGEDLNLDECF